MSPQGGAASPSKAPLKWQRVLAAFLTGRSFNRFQAERDLSDHCLHTTVSTIQGKGVRINRKFETVPGYRGIPTDCCRYWLDREDSENVARARRLMGEAVSASSPAIEFERRARAERAARGSE